MKKGLLTVLLASLVLVGCQNYDDQFDDLNAQISALKSQVDGLSSLSGQVSSLSGSISGLQAGVNAAQAAATAAGASADAATAAANGIDLSGLSASLATLQAEVDAVQASLATTSTAAAVAALQAEIDAIEADVDELLATSNVYTQALNITSSSQLDAAYALGNNINIVNGAIDINQTAAMDATKLQTVIDRIFTATGDYNFDAQATSVTPMTFNKLTSTGDLTLKVNGPISATSLVTAGTITLDDTYMAKVTSINMDALTTVTAIQTDSSSNIHKIVFTGATDIQLGSLALYTNALTITTKKGSTLDISSLDDLNSAGAAVAMSLTVTGPKDLTISNWTSKWSGTINATNVENLTVTDYKGTIDANAGVENLTVTGGVTVDIDGASDLETADITTVLFADSTIAAATVAKAAYGGYGRESTITASSTDLTSLTLNGYFTSVTSNGNGNLTTVDIDATMGALDLTNNDALTSLDVTGSQINNVTLTGNDALTAATFDHTTELNYVGATADDKDVVVIITDNTEMASLTFGATNVSSLTVTGNDKLTAIDFTGLDAASTSATVAGYVKMLDNDLTATALDTSDGIGTQYAIDGSVAATGVNNDSSDLGTFSTDAGMSTLKPYLSIVLADVDSESVVNFDTVSTLTIATGASATGSAEADGLQNSGNAYTFESNGGGTAAPKTNWPGLVYGNTKGNYASSNPTARSNQDEKRAWIYDKSVVGTGTLTIKIAGLPILETAGTFGDETILNATNNALIIDQLKSTASVSRATALGATFNVYEGANSTMPATVFRSTATSAANGEYYTDAGIAALSGGLGTVTSLVTTHDLFTMTIGGNSVTASITLASGTSATGAAADDAVASALATAWNAKYGTSGTASKTMSFWGDVDADTTSGTIAVIALKDAGSGSRAFADEISFSHSKASATTVSTVTSGAATQTFMDWTTGTDDKLLATSDNKATAVDLIISLEEVTEDAIATTQVTLIYGGTNTGYFTELSTLKRIVGVQSNTTALDIYEDDAGIYGGVGDVRADEAADDGEVVTSGAYRAYFSRIHWLS